MRVKQIKQTIGHFSLWIKWIIAGIILWYLFARVDATGLVEAIRLSRFEVYLPLSIGFVLLWFLIESQNLSALFNIFGHTIPFREMRLLELLYELCWIISAVIFYGLCLLPCWYVITEAQSVGMPFRLFFYSLSPFLFIIALIILTGLVKQLFIPKLKEGKYPFPDSGQAFVWFANRWVTDLLLVPFSRIIFLNDVFRYIALRLFGADISYSTAISSPNVTDFDLVKIGKNTTIGAWTKIYPHLQPGNGKLILAPVTIGSNSFIGADCGLMCGTNIGNHVFVAYNTTLGIYCSIGNNTTVGWFCTIGRRCNVGDNVTIGNHCHIGRNVTIRPGVTLPDYSRIPDNRLIKKSL